MCQSHLEVRHALQGLAQARKEGRLGNEDLPKCTKKARAKVCSQILEDHEARNDIMKRIMWKRTDFLRHVVGEVEEKGAINFTYVCEHCKMFVVEDMLWVTANQGERSKNNSMNGWWCGACG